MIKTRSGGTVGKFQGLGRYHYGCEGKVKRVKKKTGYRCYKCRQYIEENETYIRK